MRVSEKKRALEDLEEKLETQKKLKHDSASIEKEISLLKQKV